VLWLWNEIRRLKRDKNAFVPAHNYQVPRGTGHRDTVGDSFELAVRGPRREGAPGGLLWCPLHGEGCYTLAPDVPVYLPNQQALCSLADMDADDLEERQEFLRSLGRKSPP